MVRAEPGPARARVLLLGATGFLGRHIARELAAAGHAVVAGARRPPARPLPAAVHVEVDFEQGCDPAYWLPLLDGIDAVVNAVGILKESAGARFAVLHERAPQALFAACRQAGVRRVVQVSALGADAGARSAYHLSKRAADDYLMSLGLDAVVVQPSLVYGPGGASARLFGMMASLPLVPLPRAARAPVQPIHVDDAARAIALLADPGRRCPPKVALVGPQPLPLRDFLSALRTALGVPGRLRVVELPRALTACLARLAAALPGAAPDRETLAMLERGNTADPAPVRELLGGPPRPPAAFVAPDEAPAAAARARLDWLLPVLRASLACLWIGTGIVSLGLYPVESSYELLRRAGTPGWLRPFALYGAAALDILLGLLTLLPRAGRALWAGQAALIAFYTAVITWKLPEFWLHPYGPVLKNLPILALLLLLYQLERPWNTR
ncbi:SDR family oxidoreductase [Pigmentiphaga soli]|uniref:SDR family oxidoreductase n=1 Tax=Pigmentiphaga soli TaxID=1007095 RepID=A0ABP8GL40_9BURK